MVEASEEPGVWGGDLLVDKRVACFEKVLSGGFADAVFGFRRIVLDERVMTWFPNELA